MGGSSDHRTRNHVRQRRVRSNHRHPGGCSQEDAGPGGRAACPSAARSDRLKGLITDRDIVTQCVATGKDPEQRQGRGVRRRGRDHRRRDKPAKAVEETVEKVVDTAKSALQQARRMIPGAPGGEPPALAEPTEPRDPQPPKPDQGAPETRTPTGAETGAPMESNGQQGACLTTATGRAAARHRPLAHGRAARPDAAPGPPPAREDHALRPRAHPRARRARPRRRSPRRLRGQRHRRGRSCRAAFLAKGRRPVFVRFSTVLGVRGSADTVRDTRGFATKFYTDEGNFDLVGNNIPVFFIQDGIKFPDVIHAGKPHPDREIPQAQSAHDTFWDFVSLHTEAQHHTIWNMSDRGIPRSYRTMEGFGVHTFRLRQRRRRDLAGEVPLEAGARRPLPDLGGGADARRPRPRLPPPRPLRRHRVRRLPRVGPRRAGLPGHPRADLRGHRPARPDQARPRGAGAGAGGRPADPDANPTNFFAESEQVAFHIGHLVPGIDVTDDPLLQARLFSYLDTQLTRLGGPNFNQLPINRPHAPVNDILRDGFHQQAVHAGVAPYRPNSLDGGCPFIAGARTAPTSTRRSPWPRRRKVRANPASFDDHYSQVRLFWRSMTPVEQDHIVQAYTFELGKCYEQVIKERQLQAWPRSTRTCARRSPQGSACRRPSRWRRSPTRAEPGLSQLGGDLAGGRPDRRHRRRPRGRSRGVEGCGRRVLGRHGAAGDRRARRRRRRACRAAHLPDRSLLRARRPARWPVPGSGARRSPPRTPRPARRTRRRSTRGSLCCPGGLASREVDRRLGSRRLRARPERADGVRRRGVRRGAPRGARRGPVGCSPGTGSGSASRRRCDGQFAFIGTATTVMSAGLLHAADGSELPAPWPAGLPGWGCPRGG